MIERQRADLRRMKAIATGFLLAAVVVFVLARRAEESGAPAWVGYLRAAAEAGMVGALADWFAVTALFRRPLGLPIPHTAIVPNRKDELARSLEQFVSDNFLADEVVRDKLHRLEPTRRFGLWLGHPGTAERLTEELAVAVRGISTVLRDEDVQDLLEQSLVRALSAQPLGPPAGRLLTELVAHRAHQPLVDLLLDAAHGWLQDNEALVVRVVTDQAPAWSPRFLDDRVATRVYGELLRFVREVKTDPHHRLRAAADELLHRFAKDLQSDPYTLDRAERVQERLLRHPAVRASLARAWLPMKEYLLTALADPESDLRRRCVAGLRGLGERLTGDAELRTKTDRWVQDAAAHLLTTYRAEITTVISDTVNRWDGPETARKVELQVGRDLQFIRINGTVVGALAGLGIHLVSVVLLG